MKSGRGRTHEEAARIIRRIEETAVSKPEKYRKKIIPYLTGDYVLFDNVSVREFLEVEIGVDLEDIERFFHSSAELIATEIEENPYIQTINNLKLKNESLELKKIEFQKNELTYLGEPYLDDKLALQIPIGICNGDIKNTPIFYFNGEEYLTLMPSEMKALNRYVKEAKGRVCVIGLGIGYFPYMCALKDEVEAITIIEDNSTARGLFESKLLPLLGEKASKISIIDEDAIDYIQETQLKRDYAYTFINTFGDLSEAMLWAEGIENILKNQSGTGKVTYWLERGIKTKAQQALIQALRMKYSDNLSYNQALISVLEAEEIEEECEIEIPTSFMLKAIFLAYKRFNYKTESQLKSYINNQQAIKEILSLNTDFITKTLPLKIK